MRRVFICGYYNFPRGSASANYIQYFTKAILESFDNVYLISNVNTQEKEYLTNLVSEYDGRLKVCPVEINSNKISHYIEYNYFLGRKICSTLIRENPTKEDIIICYSSNLKINESVFKYAHKKGIKCGPCVVEWYSDEYFGKNKKELKHYRRLFYKCYEEVDFILPISTKIDEHFKEKGIFTMRLPILCDVDEYKFNPASFHKRVFFYPANGRMKDSLREMILAFSEIISSYEVELHLTGVKQSEVEKYIEGKEYDNIIKKIYCHPWMTYDELIKMYEKVNFLILARDINQMTLSNFPSKVTEAMSHGVVPVASIVGDYTKLLLIDNENSILFQGKEVNDIKGAITRAINLSDDELKILSNNAYKTVKEKHDYRSWAEPIKNFFDLVQSRK